MRPQKVYCLLEKEVPILFLKDDQQMVKESAEILEKLLRSHILGGGAKSWKLIRCSLQASPPTLNWN